MFPHTTLILVYTLPFPTTYPASEGEMNEKKMKIYVHHFYVWNFSVTWKGEFDSKWSRLEEHEEDIEEEWTKFSLIGGIWTGIPGKK